MLRDSDYRLTDNAVKDLAIRANGYGPGDHEATIHKRDLLSLCDEVIERRRFAERFDDTIAEVRRMAAEQERRRIVSNIIRDEA